MNKLIIIPVLIWDLFMWCVYTLKHAFKHVLEGVMSIKSINSMFWYFAILFRYGTMTHIYSASHSPSGIKLVKEFIEHLKVAIDENKFEIDSHHLSIIVNSETWTFWVANRWYANELNINGIILFPRLRELHQLIGLVKLAERKSNES